MTIPLSAYSGAARFVDLLLSRRSTLTTGSVRATVRSWDPPEGSDTAFVLGWRIAQRQVDPHARDVDTAHRYPDAAHALRYRKFNADLYRCAKASVTRCYEKMKRGK